MFLKLIWTWWLLCSKQLNIQISLHYFEVYSISVSFCNEIFCENFYLGYGDKSNAGLRPDRGIQLQPHEWRFRNQVICSKYSSFIIIIIIYFQNVHFFHAQLGSDVFPDMRSLHISLNTTHSECKPSSSISSSTHFLQVFLPPPAHLTPATTTFLQADISTLTFHMPKPPQSTMPHHLSHALNPKRLYKSTLRFLSFSNTPHIHLTIIRSVLSRLCRFAFFIAQVSIPYFNTLWTQALYIFPFMRYDVPRAVRIGDNSLNLAQAHLTLALAASSTPPPAPSVSPK